MRRLPESVLTTFLREVAAEHERTVARDGGAVFELRFADRRVQLRFADDALVDALLRPLASRVETRSGPIDATISIWESRRSADPLPVAWRDVDVNAGGLVRGADGERVVGVYAGWGAFTLVDLERSRILVRVPDARTMPWWERATPLRASLFWALGGAGRHLVHAGAVGDLERGGALLAGSGGSGKTTVALACLQAGMRYVGDDYLLLRSGAPTVAHNLYTTAKIDARHRACFPELSRFARRSAQPEDDEKAVLDVNQTRPGAIVDCLPVRAVIVPSIRGGHAHVRRISGAEALLALAPSTVLQMPFDGGAAMAAMAALARDVPCFAIGVGDHPAELAVAVDRVLDEVAITGAREVGAARS